MRFLPRLVAPLAILLFAGVASSQPQASAPAPEKVAYFEKKVRPILAEHCFQCHSTRAKKVRGGLLLDSRGGLLTVVESLDISCGSKPMINVGKK